MPLDRESGERVLSSAVFASSKGTNDTSVSAGDRLAENTEPVDLLRGQFEGWGLISVTAGAARRCGAQKILYSPEEGVDNPAHATIRGTRSAPVRRCLKKTCDWEIQPAL
jgi:hypothetical protein